MRAHRLQRGREAAAVEGPRLAPPAPPLPSFRTMVVAIDGPAGAGKSTVARELAAKLGFNYLDSGAMYRALALSLTETPGTPATRAQEVDIALGDRVTLDGRDVTEAIRTKEVSEAASKIASDPHVRAALVAKQRGLLEEGD